MNESKHGSLSDSSGTSSLLAGSPMAETHQIFWGDLHCHTSISSDWGNLLVPKYGPSELFNDAKSKRLDFCAVTDHAEDISEDEWKDTVAAANVAESNGFVALLGYEVCHAEQSDQKAVNVLFHSLKESEGLVFAHESFKDDPDKVRPRKYCLSYDEIWKRTKDKVIGQLTVTRADQTYGALSNIEIQAIKLVEAFSTNRSGSDTACGASNAENQVAQNHASLVGVSNNHAGEKEAPTEPGPGLGALTAVIARGSTLTRDSLLEALAEGRTYAVVNRWLNLDRQASGRIQLSFHAEVPESDPVYMGSEKIIEANSDGKLEIQLVVNAIGDSAPLSGVSVLFYRNGINVGDWRENLSSQHTVVRFSSIELDKDAKWTFIARIFAHGSGPNAEFRDETNWSGSYIAAIASPISITAK